MKKLYVLALCSLFTSCATRVDYIGTAYAPTRQVDVFVMKEAVKNPYDVIGKGYAHLGSPFTTLEKIQEKAVNKAKKKGADAVVIENYFVLHTDNSVSTSFDADSSKSVMRLKTAQAHPAIGSGFNILFIRYRQ